MRKLLTILFSIIAIGGAFSQNNTGIGTSTPRAGAALEVRSQNQGVLIPRVDTTNVTGLSALDHGLIVYDTVLGELLVWDGTNFSSLGSVWERNGAEIFIDPINAVGIGTNTPNNKLHVSGGNVNIDLGFDYEIGDEIVLSRTGSNVSVGSNLITPLVFRSGTEIARIEHTGEMAIGGPINPNASLNLEHGDKGLQLIRVDTTTLFASLGASDHGLLVFDTVINKMLVWNGGKFEQVGSSEPGGEPVGTIMAFGGGAVPGGYLLCDGSAISRTTFSGLFAAIGTSWGAGDGSTTFNLPDLRGRFLRGQNLGSGNDPNSAARTALFSGGSTADNVGSYQTDATARPNSNFTTNTTGSHSHSITVYQSGSGFGINFDNNANPSSGFTNSAGAHSHSITGGGDSETRPLNAYVQYIIKYQEGATGGVGGGTVTSVTAGTGLTGGTITAAGTIALDNSGVSAGTYGNSTTVPQITVDQYGRVTAVTNQPVLAGISGTGQINRVTYWNTGSTIAAASNFAWDNANERLGIGWGLPEVPLHIHRAAAVDVYSKYTNTVSFVGAGNGFEMGLSSSNEAILRHYEPAAMRFYTNNLERLVIDASGNVSMGGNLNVSGEVNRTSTGGANMVPIAYGYVFSNGALGANSGNVTATKEAGIGAYSITISGETYTQGNFVVQVTPVLWSAARFTFVSGKLWINVVNSSGGLADSDFSFVVYKP